MKQTRVLTQYKNRKRYDSKTKKYVSLTDIEAMIQAEENVKVTMYGTQEDKTLQALLELMHIKTKQEYSKISVTELHNRIKKAQYFISNEAAK